MTSIQLLLIIGALVVLGMLVLAVMADRPARRRPKPEQLRAAARAIAAHAAAVQAEAGRAIAVAAEARVAVAVAERSRNEAWAAQEAAERAYQAAMSAALAGRQELLELAAAQEAEGPPEGAGAGTDGDRERAVSRAALAAYRRGDISVHELREVWRRTGEGDPLQAERERTADRCRMQLSAARRVHDRTAATLRRAEQAARAAEIAAQALKDEARAWAAEAHEALLTSEHYSRRRRR
ncbi:hypothetical protein AB0J86_31675 [Micromonospora sp. NPDC049559]|uniref:hypothetical protein n=1 Tax=Micromonospora sp. NPDC049559 TaxID=3155923 RepID=UPI0034370375